MSDLGFIEVNRASGIKAVFMELPVFQIPVTDKNRILLGGDDLYNCGYWLKKQRNGYFICQNCGKEIANDKKPNGKGGRPPKYCRECAELLTNEVKSEAFCIDCGKPLIRTSVQKYLTSRCASCQAKKNQLVKDLYKKRKENKFPENPDLDKPNENMG